MTSATQVGGTGDRETLTCGIRVRGTVQGVGFRPMVCRLARRHGLDGDVCNDADGVWIRVRGPTARLEAFFTALPREAPPLARIDSMERQPLADAALQPGFRIVQSRDGAAHTHVSPDAASCAECIAEVSDPRARRHGYAFTNCTHCGPRLSIVERIPYDRANTSMAAFAMCESCRREYEDPADRRFHAQPIACPDCGPHLWLEGADRQLLARDGRTDMPSITAAAKLLRRGRVVAIKGVGGFHLAVDATDAGAVERLRRRKQRPHKPFALMVGDLAEARRICRLSEPEARLLEEAAAPIVLLRARRDVGLADAVAPGQHCYGVMLPYSPLHHLLMAHLDTPIVLTSGNRSGEPQSIDNDEARQRLEGIADAWLFHDRDIVNRVDDSVTRCLGGAPLLLRRARGHAPAPLQLPGGFETAPSVLACGGELKNTFCLLRQGKALVSQHLGDLENASARAARDRSLSLLEDLFAFTPAVVAVDAHPEYLPSKQGRTRAEADGLALVNVQHHHAHIAACLVDNAVPLDAPPVLGIALDGLGWGADGTFWGGEFLLADYRGFRRLAAFEPLPMPGAAQAIREPWRMGYSALRQYFDWPSLAHRYRHLPFFGDVTSRPLAVLDSMIASGFNTPMTSSCGRLFDAVAAVCGVRQSISYEAQAAIELEALAACAPTAGGGSYPFAILADAAPEGLALIRSKPMWRALLADLDQGTPIGTIAARMHGGMVEAIVAMVDALAAVYGDRWQGRIALSGGTLQNALVHEQLCARLRRRGLHVYRHHQLPANDGGLSVGQAVVAAAAQISPAERGKPECA